MKPEDVRTILAVHAVERADETESVLTAGDRREAATTAGAPLPGGTDREREDFFLAARAEDLARRLAARHPEAAGWVAQPPADHRFGWLALGLLLAAAAIGSLTSELAPEARINILSFPLLGIILWSLAVYLREVFLVIRLPDRGSRDAWLDGLARLVRSPALDESSPGTDGGGEGERGEALLRGVRATFESRWRRLTAPVIGARLKALLHLVALVLAGSAILGMYAKGFANEYRAVWESTFFTDAAQLRPFLRAALGPAAAITGDAFPSEAALSEMHWRADAPATAGENAARWIHWYAITMAIYVLVPRALLALVWRLRARRLAGTLAWREVDPAWFEHLIALSSGTAREVAVVPYPVRPGAALRRAVQRRLEDHFDGAVEIAWSDPVPFGEEDSAPSPPGGAPATIVVLFDFAATPEKETHLALHRAVIGDGGGCGEGAGGMVLLDTSTFDRRSVDFPDAEGRRAEREAAWRRLFETEGTELLQVASQVTEPFDAFDAPH